MINAFRFKSDDLNQIVAEGRWIIYYGAKDALISTNNPIDSMLSVYTSLWENDEVLEEMGCYQRIALNNGTSEHYPNNLQNANYTIEFPDYYDQETFTGILTVTIKLNGLSTTADILIKEN